MFTSSLLLAALVTSLTAPPTHPEPELAQVEADLEGESASGSSFHFGVEAKAHFRDSESVAFPSPFPFDPIQLPVGQDAGMLETVSSGDHFELSTVTLLLDAAVGQAITAHFKIDVIDLYDRNPTSGDRQLDVDEAWIRFGRESAPGRLPDRSGAYFKVGKFGKFERQDDRHLESYGLVSTAFNRFEDLGLELGFDIGRHFYMRTSLTQGNPLFFRDPNALAGDNGTDDLLRPNPEPALKSGLPILYDAEVEDIDTDGEQEVGVGLGLRLGDASGRRNVDFLAFRYSRELADTVDLEGTFYGGDLDLLQGPFNAASLPISGRDKEEVGANLWLYLSGFSLFAQFVDQEVAGLDRTGYELEAAFRFDLPVKWAVGGRQLFPYLQPAVRFSRLEPEFAGGSPFFPAPSVRWEWEKIDIGLRLGLLQGVDVTAEWGGNTFVVRGNDETMNEVLVTLRWRS